MHSTSFTHIAIVCVGVGLCWIGGKRRKRRGRAGQLLLRLLPVQLYSNIRHKLSLKMPSKKFSLFRKLLLPFWPTLCAASPPSYSHTVCSFGLVTNNLNTKRAHTHTRAHTLTHAHMSLKTIWQLAARSAICCGSSLLAAPFIGHKPV